MLYNTQNNVRIRLTGLGNITGYSSAKIKYKKPDETMGSWVATVENLTTGIIYYDMLSTESLTTGIWYFWAYVTFPDGRKSIGESTKTEILDEGEVI